MRLADEVFAARELWFFWQIKMEMNKELRLISSNIRSGSGADQEDLGVES
jgi:hypothetical protein